MLQPIPGTDGRGLWSLPVGNQVVDLYAYSYMGFGKTRFIQHYVQWVKGGQAAVHGASGAGVFFTDPCGLQGNQMVYRQNGTEYRFIGNSNPTSCSAIVADIFTAKVLQGHWEVLG